MIRVLIAGYHGFGNCGDEAILQAMTTNIRAMAKDVEITALSYNPEFTKNEYGINSVQRFSMLQVLSAIRHSDIVLSGGGTLLQNGTSTRSLMYYLTLIKVAKFFRKRVMLYANGIGPVSGKLNRRLVKMVVNTVDVITLREKLSEADLKSIGVTKPNIMVTADPAFNLESISDEEAWKLLDEENIPHNEQMIAVSVRNWSKAYGGDDYVKKVAKICDNAIVEGKTVVFLPMEYPRDLELSKKVMSYMKEKAYIMQKRYNPSQILGIVGCFDIMLSMRLHTLIFAAVKNVPMLGIIYDPKVEYYIKELDMIEAGDVRHSPINVRAVNEQINDVFENMSDYKARLKFKADLMKQRAGQNDVMLAQQFDIIRKGKDNRR